MRAKATGSNNCSVVCETIGTRIFLVLYPALGIISFAMTSQLVLLFTNKFSYTSPQSHLMRFDAVARDTYRENTSRSKESSR